MRLRAIGIALTAVVVASFPALAQVTMTGRLEVPRYPGSGDMMPLTAINVSAAVEDPMTEPLEFRTFETYPAGWYLLTGSAGNYTQVFTAPARFPRPLLRTNIFMKPGETVDQNLTPNFDYGVFDMSQWDEVPAKGYYQTFIARGTSVTHVGFLLVHDGVDGQGPGSQDFLVSIHRKGQGDPDTWKQVGPAMKVPNVDTGGAKQYISSAGWNSGEVPTVPGETYAVYVRPESGTGVCQAHWRDAAVQETDCYRIGADAGAWTGKNIWMAVGTDSDGCVIPYNKRIHKEFGEMTEFGTKWAQTYVAKGKSLAFVYMYAATDGTQPPIWRQRCMVRVREGRTYSLRERSGRRWRGMRGAAFDGPVVGIEKMAIGTGNWTGDASWGGFAVTYAPGEVPLTPGKTYAIEFDLIETRDTIGNWVNIKKQKSTGIPGFTTYKKHPLDDYAAGTSRFNGERTMDYDLDMQIIEYENTADNWSEAVHEENLLANGGFDEGEYKENDANFGGPNGWERFMIDPGTSFWYVKRDDAGAEGRYVKMIGGAINSQTVDGGYVQKISGLSHLETYRLTGQVRCSWAVSRKHQCHVGYDPTGQVESATAETIAWDVLPRYHAFWVDYMSEPIRPAGDSISVWVRGRTVEMDKFTFEADFDNFALRRVRTDVPRK